MLQETSSWLFEGNNVAVKPAKHVGFVYLIENLKNGRRYIGKKLLTSTRHKRPLSGYKRRRKIVKESDWQDYYGSCKELLEDVAKHGKGAFRRTILRFCETKGETSYWEAKFQFEHDVILHPDQWYNSQIRVRVHRTHVPNF